MPEHDNVSDLEGTDAEFERCRHTVSVPVRRVRRHDIRHVTDNEKLAGPRVKNDFRRNAGVATADDNDLRRLPAFGKTPVAVLLVTEPTDEKGAISIDQLLRKCHWAAVHKTMMQSHTIMAASSLATRRKVGVACRSCER